jgi:hypothetical protein
MITIFYQELVICYSKEISLLAGSAIYATSGIISVKYHLQRFARSKYSKCLFFLLLGYLCIGTHQAFEWWAIGHQSIIAYKIGLFFSIFAMYVNILASEAFFGRSIGSKYILLLLGLLIIHMTTREMSFENMHFYVRGESHFYWGALWLIFFLYWNFMHYLLGKNLPRELKKINYKIPFYSLNISFLLSAFYSYSFGLYQNIVGKDNLSNFCGGILSNFEIVFDAPSIWCVFATIQGVFLYRFGGQILALENQDFSYKGKLPVVKALSLTFLVWIIIFLSLPMFSGLSYKMILK